MKGRGSFYATDAGNSHAGGHFNQNHNKIRRRHTDCRESVHGGTASAGSLRSAGERVPFILMCLSLLSMLNLHLVAALSVHVTQYSSPNCVNPNGNSYDITFGACTLSGSSSSFRFEVDSSTLHADGSFYADSVGFRSLHWANSQCSGTPYDLGSFKAINNQLCAANGAGSQSFTWIGTGSRPLPIVPQIQIGEYARILYYAKNDCSPGNGDDLTSSPVVSSNCNGTEVASTTVCHNDGTVTLNAWASTTCSGTFAGKAEGIANGQTCLPITGGSVTGAFKILCAGTGTTSTGMAASSSSTGISGSSGGSVTPDLPVPMSLTLNVNLSATTSSAVSAQFIQDVTKAVGGATSDRISIVEVKPQYVDTSITPSGLATAIYFTVTAASTSNSVSNVDLATNIVTQANTPGSALLQGVVTRAIVFDTTAVMPPVTAEMPVQMSVTLKINPASISASAMTASFVSDSATALSIDSSRITVSNIASVSVSTSVTASGVATKITFSIAAASNSVAASTPSQRASEVANSFVAQANNPTSPLRQQGSVTNAIQSGSSYIISSMTGAIDSGSSNDIAGMSLGALIGICVGCSAGLLILVCALWWAVCKNRGATADLSLPAAGPKVTPQTWNIHVGQQN